MRTARLDRHAAASTALLLCTDQELSAALDAAPIVTAGIGGSAVRLEIAGVPVFAKRVPLTELERRDGDLGSTANVFGLPTFYHYGLGSAGCGVWRELSAVQAATEWVLSGRCESFPLLYHWRRLPLPPRDPIDPADRERQVEFWGGSAGVRNRLTQLDQATESLVLFSEYVPTPLSTWLHDQLDEAERIEEQLITATEFMADNGLVHFDAHFANILTDGETLYFADLGLALADWFELTEAERSFADRHRPHDRAYVTTHLVHSLVSGLTGVRSYADRVPIIRHAAAGTIGLSGPAAAIMERHAPTAVIMNEFYDALQHRSRETPFPAEPLLSV